MQISSDPWQHPDPEQSRLRLVQVPSAVLHALARGEAVDADGHSVTAYLAGRECASLWRMRSQQVADTPTDAPWVTRFVQVIGEDAPVGVAGFHGPPDRSGMVEVGYRIDPTHRRRGYARHALEILLAVARAHPDVRVVRATISPENTASRSLVESHGFVDVGEQWDDEDGLETIFELGVDAGSPPGRHDDAHHH